MLMALPLGVHYNTQAPPALEQKKWNDNTFLLLVPALLGSDSRLTFWSMD